MAFTYCTSCGYKNQHGVNAPRFCGGCGEVLGGPKPSKAKVAKRKVASELRSKSSTKVRADIEEESSEIDFVPDVSNFKYSISEGDMGGGKMNLKDLAGEITEDQLEEVKSSERASEASGKRLDNGKTRKRKK